MAAPLSLAGVAIVELGKASAVGEIGKATLG